MPYLGDEIVVLTLVNLSLIWVCWRHNQRIRDLHRSLMTLRSRLDHHEQLTKARGGAMDPP